MKLYNDFTTLRWVNFTRKFGYITYIRVTVYNYDTTLVYKLDQVRLGYVMLG